ncbi:NAD(P)-dependent oxidoreductase [Komagataeibacter medellinensis]|uniref:NAD(P)-dependent oxidoreductase n=2 Tax=Komagataeibacter medellinensis TaxID=1177712 RepID=A0ABQ6VR16_9PROT|nr:NAD(P)-dependent oxidoreductase [Komagataeibacter medellinensis]
MGHSMAQRLLAAGRGLYVYNRTAAGRVSCWHRAQPCAPTPPAAAQGANIVFFDDATAQVLTFGPGGIATTLGADAIHACCSTLSPKQARRLRDGHAARDGGGEWQAGLCYSA